MEYLPVIIGRLIFSSGGIAISIILHLQSLCLIGLRLVPRGCLEITWRLLRIEGAVQFPTSLLVLR
jgi:hypothetical protein